MDTLDSLVLDRISDRLLTPERVEALLRDLVQRRLQSGIGFARLRTRTSPPP